MTRNELIDLEIAEAQQLLQNSGIEKMPREVIRRLEILTVLPHPPTPPITITEVEARLKKFENGEYRAFYESQHAYLLKLVQNKRVYYDCCSRLFGLTTKGMDEIHDTWLQYKKK
ncbi:MAG: hypothetical protein KBD24_02345 [Candidatus Pacebacteria bacterium]|nr:hypothetical protein [Candidatus Paceibacterota bacterium]